MSDLLKPPVSFQTNFSDINQGIFGTNQRGSGSTAFDQDSEITSENIVDFLRSALATTNTSQNQTGQTNTNQAGSTNQNTQGRTTQGQVGTQGQQTEGQTVEQIQYSDAALQELIRGTLSGEGGVQNIGLSARSTGLYNSTSQDLLLGNLYARAANQAAIARAPRVVSNTGNVSGTNNVQNVTDVSENVQGQSTVNSVVNSILQSLLSSTQQTDESGTQNTNQNQQSNTSGTSDASNRTKSPGLLDNTLGLLTGGLSKKTVICSALTDTGYLEHRNYLAAAKYFLRLHTYTRIGYHQWGIPVAERIRAGDSKLANFWLPFAKSRTELLCGTGSFWQHCKHPLGTLTKFVIQPACFCIGAVVVLNEWLSTSYMRLSK